MNIAINNSAVPTSAAPVPAGAAPAAADLALAGAVQAPGTALQFAQWLGLGVQADDAASLPAPGAPADATADATDGTDSADSTGMPAADAAAPADAAAVITQESAPLPAMTMPLQMMPFTAPVPAPLADAAAAALPAAATSGAAPVAAKLSAQPAPQQAAPADQQPGAFVLPAAFSAVAAPVQVKPQQVATAEASSATPATIAKAAVDTQDSAPERSASERSAPVVANWNVSTAAAPAAPAAPSAPVTLAGPPTAWRQTLQEALGERLNLQLGRGAEQAVIRLDPPNLGRIEIAIRHAAGSLEVTMSATHSEVVRQLHSVTENLRNDLSQRQFGEVQVSVTPAPRNPTGQAFGEQQGRQRQPGREQDNQGPGRALADASNPSSTFSMAGRE